MNTIYNNSLVFLLTLCFIAIINIAKAQESNQLTFSPENPFSNSFGNLYPREIKYADLDANGLLDPVAIATSQNGRMEYITSSAHWSEGLIYCDSVSIIDWVIVDINNTNHLDIVMLVNRKEEPTPYSEVVVVYNYRDNLANEVLVSNLQGIKQILLADYDQNGWRDLVLSPSPFQVYFQDNGQFSSAEPDSSFLNIEYAFMGDFNGDTHQDILVSKKDSSESYSEWMSNTSNGTFTRHSNFRLPFATKIAEMDVNADGLPDYLLSNDSSDVYMVLNYVDSMVVKEHWQIDDVKSLFLADLNTDGLTDILIGSSKANIILQNQDSTFADIQEQEMNPNDSIISITLSKNGFSNNLRLSMALKVDTFGYVIKNYNSNAPENKGPTGPFLSAGMFINGDLNLFWESPTDDFTPTASISFDVEVRSYKRTDMIFRWIDQYLLNKGNVAYANELTIRNVTPGDIHYNIFPIDNAFTPFLMISGSGNYFGMNGIVTVCEPSNYTFDYLCGGADEINLNFNEVRAWYSSKKGFMGFSNSYNQVHLEADTLYSVLPGSVSCNNQKAWIINIISESNLITQHDTTICSGALITQQLDSSVWVSAAWTTASNKFLSNNFNIQFGFAESDTLFLEAKKEAGCTAYDTLIINVAPTETNLSKSTTACLWSNVSFELSETEWNSAVWVTQSLDTLSTELTLSFIATQPEVINLRAISKLDCEVFDTLNIIIEEVTATVIPESITIYKGDVANLQANGGLYYEWFPSTDLHNPYVANPQTSSLESIVYQVVVSSATGCADTAQVNVTVLNQAFAANLFSPNSDGNNDNWKIIELKGVSQFKLVIVDREGQIMYETNQEYEAANLGWDGTKNGTPQPAGVYFWKVSGRYIEGNEITLNGAKEGQILLMR